jgi:thioredoxin-related protein
MRASAGGISMRRLALLALLVPCGVAGAGEPPPVPRLPLSVDVRTEPAPFDAQKPGDPRLTQAPTPLVVSPTAPEGAPKVAGTDEVQYATLAGGRAKVALSFVGDDLRVLLADGPGSADAPQSLSGKAEPWTQPQTGRRLGTRWRVTGGKVAGQEVVFTVARRGGATSGSLTLASAGPGERPTTLALDFYDEVPSSVDKPADLGAKALHAVAVSKTKVIAVSAAFGDGDALTAVVDGNADDDLSTPAERVEAKGESVMTAVGTESKRTGTRWTVEDVDLGGRRATLKVERTDAVVNASVNATAGRRGRVDVGGVEHALFLLDGDLDGGYAGASDLWWFGPATKFPARGLNYSNMFEGNEAHYSRENAWKLVSVASDGTARVEHTESVSHVGVYLARRAKRVNETRWFPMFQAEAAGFARDRGIDLAAPKAEKEPVWHFVASTDAALALARNEKKPLLVDFEADWCVWCKRLDYYTYPDREVAAALSKFTLVKMNTELAWSEEWKDYWSGGLPTLAGMTVEGLPVTFVPPVGDGERKPVDRLPGWHAPKDFVQILDALHKAATAK